MRKMRTGWMALGMVLLIAIAGAGQCGVEVEPNDAMDVADYMGELPGSSCFEGQIEVVGDVDYFYFTLTSARWVTIETITSEDTEIALIDAFGTILSQNDDFAVDVVSSYINTFLQPGEYYIAVFEHGNDNVIYNYTLSVVADLCIYEVEDNDTVSLADYLGDLPGDLCGYGTIGIVGDIDFYYFTVAAAQWVVIETITNEDTEISLFDNVGSLIARNDDIAIDVYSSYISAFLNPGTYAVAVFEHGNDNVIYDYTLSVSGRACTFEIEPNDDSVLADALGTLPGSLCASGAIDVVGDLDYYSFDLVSPAFVQIYTTTTGDSEIALFDAVGNTLAVNDDVAAGDYSSWIGQDLAPGTYYVAVREFGSDGLIDAYTLNLDAQ